ncbi:13002_t:CDS:10 [Entrophospora sp. SA101]|nr:13002_t:CDS:10 [Entrophospora sp. SA101]
MTTDEIDDGRSSIRSSDRGDQGDDQGYDQKILTTFSGFAGNVNNMLGSGIYSTPGIVWQTVNSPGVALIIWIYGGFVSLCGSLTYVEFGTITLESGGETGFFKKAFPKPKLLISYLFSFAWICAIRPASLGAVLQVLAQHFLFVVIPHPPENTGNTTVDEHEYCQASEKFHRQLHPNNDWGLEFWTLKIIGIIALSIITFYHIFSNVWASRINQAPAVVKMLTLTVIISIGFVQLVRTDVSKPNWQNPFYVTENLSFSSVAGALISVYSLDEFKDPKGRLIYSNSLSVTVVTILYTLTNVAFITVVNSKDVNRHGKDFNEVIAGNFAKEIGGEKFGRALSFFVALSAFGAASSMTWRFLDDKKYTPRNALLAQFIWCVMVFVILGGAFSSDPFKTLAIRPASLGAVLQVLAQHFLFVVIPHPPENTGNTTVDEHEYCQASEKFHRQLHPNNDWGLEFWTLKIIGIIALSIITFYHIFSNVWASRINQAPAVVKMLTLTVIISIGFVQLVRTDVSKPNWQNPFYVTENLSFSSVAGALISVYSLDEFKDPKGRLIYSNSLSVTVVTILYTLTNVAFITVVNSKDVNRHGKDFNEVIAGNFAKEIGGEKFGRALSFFVALSAFGAASSMTWRFLDDKKYTPRNALLAQFIWCVMVFVILGGAFSSDPFKTLSDFSTYFAWIFYFLASIGLLWLRYKEAEIDRSFKVPNSLIAIFICSAIFIIIGNAIKKDIPKPSTSDYDDCQKNAITIDQYIIPIICGGFLFVGAGCWCISYFRSGGNSRNNNIRGDVSSENRDNNDNSDNKIVSTSL